MCAAPTEDYITSYIEEVQGYVPEMKEGISSLRSGGQDDSVVVELHRLAHIIRGASSMVGIEGLSLIAGCMEDYLELAVEVRAKPTDEALLVMDDTVDSFGNFCQEYTDGITFDKDGIVVKAGQDYGRLSEQLEAKAPDVFDHQGTFIPGDLNESGSVDSYIIDTNEFIDEFREEAEEHLQDLDVSLGQFQAAVDKEQAITPELREIARSIRRSVHTIKGASAVIGLKELPEYAHKVEDFLDYLFEEADTVDPSMLENLATAIDLLAILIETPEVFDNDRASETLKKLFAYSQGQKVEAPQKQAAEEVGSESPASQVVSSVDQAYFTEEEQQELLVGFREEADEHFQDLNISLKILEDGISEQIPLSPEHREEVRAIRRAVHTIKGASAVIGLQDISALAHKIEDPLDWLYEDAVSINPQIVSDIVSAIDMLVVLVETPDQLDETKAEAILGQLADHTNQPSDTEEEKERVPVSTSIDQAFFSDKEQQELLLGFHDEAEEHLQDLDAALTRLGAEIVDIVSMTSSHSEEIRGIRRSVHTIKGAAAVIGLEAIAGFAHVLEDFLDWLFEQAKDIGPEHVQILVTGIDLLSRIMGEPATVEPGQLEEIVGQLRGFYVVEVNDPFWTDIDAPTEVQEAWKTSPAIAKPVRQSTAELQTLQPDTVTTLRVKKDQIDSIVNLANELLVGVSSFDGKMELFKEALVELELTRTRLKDIALELEKNFEVKALEDMDKRFQLVDQKLAELGDGESFEEFDSLELDRYTQLNLTIRSLNESAIDVGAIQGNMTMLYSDIDGEINRQRRNIRALQLQSMRTRMSPMSSISARMGRTMRDVSAKLGKKVRMHVEGDTVELDRVIWEKLADPFMHLVRNSVHHGIESSEERAAVGKSPIAKILMSAERKGNRVVIQFGDDGRGLDYDAIRVKAAKLGLGDQVAGMNEQQLTDLIFTPGFSTKTISDISGRGVGLDIVKAAIQELQGRISIETKADEGTTFVISIPLTLGVVRSLMFDSGGKTLAIPLNDISEIRRAESEELDIENRQIRLANETLPLYYADGLLGVIGFDPYTDVDDRPLVLLMDLGSERAALVISKILDQKELVIKDLGVHLKSVSGISGAAILGDGSLVPVLNVSDLVQVIQQPQKSIELPVEAPRVHTLNIMIVDDSISIRRVVGRLVSAQGWVPFEAKDGLDALEQLPAVVPDLIILDVEMPRMNGFEFLAKVANIPEHKDTPIVMLTSRTSTKHREKAFSLGATAFLNKPYKDDEFIKLVKELTNTVHSDSAGATKEAA